MLEKIRIFYCLMKPYHHHNHTNNIFGFGFRECINVYFLKFYFVYCLFYIITYKIIKKVFHFVQKIKRTSIYVFFCMPSNTCVCVCV